MSSVDAFIGGIPDKKERRYAGEIISNLWGILDNLNKRGYLRTELRGRGKEKTRKEFLNIIENSDKFAHAFNSFFDMYMYKDKIKQFYQLGFTKDDLKYLLLSQLIFIFLVNVELFKNAFLFLMKANGGLRPDMTLGQLVKKLYEFTDGQSDVVAKEIDVGLRNSLAHGLFWKDEKAVVHYFKDITMQEKKSISLPELFLEGKRHNIVCQSLIRLVPDWFIGT